MKHRAPLIATLVILIFTTPAIGQKPMPIGPTKTPYPISSPPFSTAVGFTLGFSVEGEQPYWDTPWFERPLFEPFNRNSPSWWENVIHEAATIAEADFVAPVIRGCRPDGTHPPGNSCAKLLRHLRTSVRNYNANAKHKKIHVAPFLDTAAFPLLKYVVENQTSTQSLLFTQTVGLAKPQVFWILKNRALYSQGIDTIPLDLSSETDAHRYFWELNLREFFLQIPEEQLFKINGKVLVTLWSNSQDFGFINHYINPEKSSLQTLEYLRRMTRKEFGYELYLFIDKSWPNQDPNITPQNVDGVNNWFEPLNSAEPNFSIREWGNNRFAIAAPGFHDPIQAPKPYRVVERDNGDTLRITLAIIERANPTIVLLEGLTDIEESACYCRSREWSYPSLYLHIVRNFIRRTQKNSLFSS